MSTGESSKAWPRVSDGRRAHASEYWWLARVWLIVAVFTILTAVAAHHVGIPVRDPDGAWVRSRVVLSLALFLVLIPVDACVRARRRGWPSMRGTLRMMRHRWTPRRMALVVSALLAYYDVNFCYHNLKSWVVFHQPQDDLLQRWDGWLFPGHSPAGLLHDLLGQNVAAYVLMAIYMSFSTVVLVSIVGVLVFVRRTRRAYVFIASASWVWILGVGSYYLIPSLGPFSSAPQQFSGLPHTMTQDTQARYLAQRAHLLTEPMAPDATAQIAAFASLHVAIVCLLLLTARYYRLRRTSWALSVYLVGTGLATVYLGWHYVVDVAAGLAIAVAALALGQLTIYPRRGLRWVPGRRGHGHAPCLTTTEASGSV